MSEVVTSIHIAAPVDVVWATCLDPERLHEWVTIHRELHDHSGGELREGYTMEQTLCLRGVRFKVQWELTVCKPPHRAEWRGRAPARARAETEYRLSPVDGGTRFDYRNAFRPPLGPLGAVVGRALAGGLPEREADGSLQRLKALLER